MFECILAKCPYTKFFTCRKMLKVKKHAEQGGKECLLPFKFFFSKENHLKDSQNRQKF